MDETQFAITVLLGLLLLSSAVAMLTYWLPVPYTLLLVIVGLVISPMHFLPAVHITPDLILLIFLPALLFEAAWNFRLSSLRLDLVPILTLAVGGVLVSVGVIGTVLHAGAGIAWPAALLFGAMIAATDPVSVLALFRQAGLSARLTSLIEGESLVNDGAAIAMFGVLVGVATGRMDGSAGEVVWRSAATLIGVSIGGAAVGTAVGLLASTLTSHFDDRSLEITLTTTSAYGAYLLADRLHLSAVIAVLAAGLIIGNFGRQRGMSARTQLAVNLFWEYGAFVANSLVFLLIGLETHLWMIAANVRSIAWALGGMLAARGMVVYGLLPFAARFGEAPVSLAWRHVLTWGALRGSVSIALALSLPSGLPGRQEFVAMTFGVVTVSLLGQGLTLGPLIRRLGLGASSRDPQDEEYQFLEGLLLTDVAARRELERMERMGFVGPPVAKALRAAVGGSRDDIQARLEAFDVRRVTAARRQFAAAAQRLFDRKRARLDELTREGLLSESVRRRLIHAIDEQQAASIPEDD